MIELPLPPPANNAYFNLPRGGRALTKDARRWQNAVVTELKVRRLPYVGGASAVHILVPTAMRGDIDGRIKLLLDALVKAGRIDDDRNVWRLQIERSNSVPAGMARVTWGKVDDGQA